jgi:hypothetical protein
MNEILSSKSEVSLTMIYDELINVRRKLEAFEDILMPGEEVPKDELIEIEQLKLESLKGDHVRWDELKKRLSI